MIHVARLKQIRRKLKQLKRDFESGAIDKDVYDKAEIELMLAKFEVINLIDGLGSPSERKAADVAPCAEIPATPRVEIPVAPADPFVVSPAIRCILERFNHLTIDEAIAFGTTIIGNGRPMMTHGGVFAATRRRWSESSRRLAGQFDVYWSWTCCNSIVAHNATPTHVTFVRCRKSEKPSSGGVYDALETSAHSCSAGECKNPELHKSAPDLTNRNPIGRCDSPTMFYLLTQ